MGFVDGFYDTLLYAISSFAVKNLISKNTRDVIDYAIMVLLIFRRKTNDLF